MNFRRADSDVLDHVRPVSVGGSTRHVLAVQAALRPLEPSLPRTIAALDGAGLSRWVGPRLIEADGHDPGSFPGWEVRSSGGRPRGSAITSVSLFRHAIEICPDFELLTYLQDDVELCRNALDYFATTAIADDLVLLSWFSLWWRPGDEVPRPTLGVRDVSLFYNSQAITIPRRTIDRLLASEDVLRWPFEHRCDLFYSAACRPAPYATHYPNLVQHTDGLNSACDHAGLGARYSTTYPGVDFDAMSLVRFGRLDLPGADRAVREERP